MEERLAETELEKRILLDQLASGEELAPENYPRLFNLSTAFEYQYIFRPRVKKTPEFVYVPFCSHPDTTNEDIFIHQWDMFWEAGHLREKFFEKKLPQSLSCLKRFDEANLYLLPNTKPRYEAYTPLYHLLPKRLLEQYSLPLIKSGIWPIGFGEEWILRLLNENFEQQLSKAFAHHVWPLLIQGSRITDFSKDDSIVVLAHNLDYWLPFAYQVAENRLREFPRVNFENTKQKRRVANISKKLPPDIFVEMPLKGGDIWTGEDDAWAATQEMVETADKQGKLRAIIEAIQCNRVEDDFSPYWSHAREDFERKFYHKRSKVKVAFVELADTIPVHGPESECEGNLLWEDFFAILNKKERSIVVCLKNGITNHGEIGELMGYKNHSPVSKALARIRQKAKQFFE
jgi:hypothetical protein